MTIIQLIILQVIAHMLADFTFQPQYWCDKKDKNLISRYLFYHTTIVFITSYVLSFDVGFIIGSAAITITHFSIDIMKSWIILHSRVKYIFFIDQLLHLIALTGIVWLYDTFFGIHFLFPMNTKILAILA